MKLTPYRLPDERIVQVDATAAKDAPTILFELDDKALPHSRGTIVTAVRVETMGEYLARREDEDGGLPWWAAD